MTREELIELAALDAFGLLDEYEAALFTRSFHHAPAAVQSEIVRIQAELAGDPALLPEEEPSPDLRQKVLAAVAQAMETETSRLAPLATIGSPALAGGLSPDVLGRIDSRGPRTLVWRAAAFALAGAVIVMAYFYAEAAQQRQELARYAIQADMVQLERMLGPGPSRYILDASRKVHLSPTDSADRSAAAVYMREDRNDLCLIHRLPRSDENEYTLRAVLASGEELLVQSFRGVGIDRLADIGTITVTNLEFALASVTRWEILDATGAVLMTT